jgi:hypothetical protein
MPPLLDLLIVGAILALAVRTLVRHLTRRPGAGICSFAGDCHGCELGDRRASTSPTCGTFLRPPDVDRES